MRLLSIGDVHGRLAWQRFLFPGSSFNAWKEQLQYGVKPEEFPMLYSHDRIVFTGDYVDSHYPGLSDVDIMSNLANIVELKRILGDRVVLLLGNHDVQYILGGLTFSGYRPSMKHQLRDFFSANDDAFGIAYQVDGFLFTHAGVTQSYRQTFMDMAKIEEFADVLNSKWKEREESLTLVSWRRGGDSPVPGPTWSDRDDMLEDPIDGITQVVGHTPVQLIHSFLRAVVFTDCQSDSKVEQFLFIDTSLGFDGIKVLTRDPNTVNPLRFKLEPNLKFDSIANHSELSLECLSSQR